MKYWMKLYLAFVTTALVSTLLGLGIGYSMVKIYLLDELHHAVMSIAATATAALDGDLLKKIQTRADEKTATYQQLQMQLRKIRDLNRRPDMDVKFIYTIIPSKIDPSQFVFQLDAEEPTANFSHVGEKVTDVEESLLQQHLNEIYSPNDFITDKWGTWITGYAPIYDKQGHYVATLGVDLQAEHVIIKLSKLFYAGLFAFLSALTLALICAFFLSREASRSLALLCKGVDDVTHGNLDTKIFLKTHDEFHTLADMINQMIRGLRERERLGTNFARYVSQHVLESILAVESPINLKGERRKVTVLFSDIREFTRLAEKLSPENVVSLLNEYFSLMVEIIFKYNGSLDKFIGDGMMIEFGAPLPDEKQELHSVLTAIEMQKAIKKLNEKWLQEGKHAIDIGIGIHTGIVIVGNIGSEKRISYTAIGDTVNIASRLEKLTREVNTSILISEATVKSITSNFNFKNLGPITLRGRTDQTIVYSLIDFEYHPTEPRSNEMSNGEEEV